jgi:tryptophanyl-tRNA synthetase
MLLGTDKRKMSKSYGNSILMSDEPAVVEEKIKGSVTDRPKLTDRGSPDRCPVGNLHQIFSDPARLAHITEGCTQATITCVECKALAVQSVNAHLGPIRERRRELEQNPARLRDVIQLGAQKANAAAEATMVAARDAIGLLRVGAAVATKDAATQALRVPESIAGASTDDERWEIRTSGWLERVNKTYPLKKDRPRTFITRKGRKVGVHTASERADGTWSFELQDRPLNVLVLLAQDKDLTLHDYVLPPKILQDYWKKFVRHDNIVAITMQKGQDGAAIRVGTESLPIEQFKSDYSALQ